MSLLLFSSFVVKFFLCHCMFSPCCLFHRGVILLLFWFPALLISCSVPPVNVNSWWLWMQLPCLLSQGWSLFLWINKLLLPLCACLCVSMVHLHVISFGNTVGCHCMLCFELTCLCFWRLCSFHPVVRDPLLFLAVSFLADVVFGCYGRIQSGWRRSSTCSGPTRNFTRRYTE